MPVLARALLALLVNPLLAQEAYHESILLPITIRQPVAGAFGSTWATQFTITSVGGAVWIANLGCYACPPHFVIPEGQTLELNLGDQSRPPGGIYLVRRDSAKHARFHLRVYDLSRSSTNWGTELPVVRESELFTEPLLLPNVPLDARFRLALRIYEVDWRRVDYVRREQDVDFVVSIYDRETGQLQSQHTFRVVPGVALGESFPMQPSTVEIIDLHRHFGLPTSGRINIHIRPVQPDVRFWAFVSVTNNETQHVTTVTPQ